jgi:hypothetical protein
MSEKSMERNAKLVNKLTFIAFETSKYFFSYESLFFFSFLIDLQRLYTKGIEAPNFDKLVLNNLRQKSAQISKTIEPIDRSKC